MSMKNLMIRTAVAVIGIPAIFFLIMLGNWGFAAFVIAVQWISWLEYAKLQTIPRNGPRIPIVLIGILFMNWALFYRRWDVALIIIFTSLILISIESLFHGGKGAISRVSGTFFGFLYITLFSSLLLLRELPRIRPLEYSEGGRLVILLLGIIWICDTAAYFWGSAFGRRALAPKISPNKTWEGAIAGFTASVLVSIPLFQWLLPRFSWENAAVIGGLIGLLGQTGDLVESMLKRDAGVKDSSNLIPGHGGVLDRFDSPLLAGPAVLFYLLKILG